MSTIHLHQTTTSTPEQLLAALIDFGPGRSKLEVDDSRADVRRSRAARVDGLQQDGTHTSDDHGV